jgi:hypothetical protein
MYTLTPLRSFVELLRKLFTLILDAPRTSAEKNSENVSFKGKFDQKLVEQPPFQENAACKRNMCAVNR